MGFLLFPKADLGYIKKTDIKNLNRFILALTVDLKRTFEMFTLVPITKNGNRQLLH